MQQNYKSACKPLQKALSKIPNTKIEVGQQIYSRPHKKR